MFIIPTSNSFFEVTETLTISDVVSAVGLKEVKICSLRLKLVLNLFKKFDKNSSRVPKIMLRGA